MRRAGGGALVAGLLLAGLELALRLSGWQPAHALLYAAFDRTRLFVPGEGAGGEPVLRTNPAYLSRFYPQAFARDKAGGFRVFVLGESAAAGWRLADPAAERYSSVLAARLSRALPHRRCEVINAAGTSLGSGRLRVLAEELAGYQPDLLITGMGNNEFLEFPVERALRAPGLNRDKVLKAAERSALAAWMLDRVADVRMRAGGGPVAAYPPLSDAEAGEAVARFGEHLRAIVRCMHAAGAAVICCTLPANLRVDPDRADDWLADAARHRPDLDREAWDAAWNRGRLAEERGDWRAAVAAFGDARRLDPGYARTWRELGRCREALGDTAGASDAFWTHLDLSRRLVTRELNREIRRVAREEGADLVDLAGVFAHAAPRGLPGYDLFNDSMHPNARGHALIAAALLPVVRAIAAGRRGAR